MKMPLPKPTAMERYTGKRTPKSMQPMTESRTQAIGKRMAAKEKSAAKARQNVMTGNFASD